VDEKIEGLEKKYELFSEYKKGVMRKIFSQEIRFKNENGKQYPDWEEKKISEIFEITRGYVLATGKIKNVPNNEFRYPVYSSQTARNGLLGYYDKYLFENCITWTTDGANAGDVNFRHGKFYCTNVCGVLKDDNGYANLCIAEILNRNTRNYVSYVGNPKLMNNVMSMIKITIPKSIEEQQKIADFLTLLDNKIDQINNSLTQAKLFKKSLLQKMFA